MSVVASLLSLVLFIAFASAGAQKILFNPAVSRIAGHLGFTKRVYQRVGGLEVIGAIAVLAGMAAQRSTFLGILNIAAAGGLTVLMAMAVITHLRKSDALKFYAPALGLGVLAVIELVARLT